MTLAKVVDAIVDIIAKRAQNGKNCGVALIPEGLIEFIPEMKELISALNDVLAENSGAIAKMSSIEDKKDFIFKKLQKDFIVI